MKNLNNLHVTPFANEEILQLIKLYKFKGKDFHYGDKMHSDIDGIMRLTVENECVEFMKFFKINLTDNRKNLIIKKDAQPKNKDEQLIYNFKQVISRFLADPLRFELLTNDVNSMMKLLYNKIENVTFNSKVVNLQVNLLTEKKRVSTRNDLEELLKTYDSLHKSGKYESLFLIINFYIDLIHMNIFSHGNELGSLILMYALILQDGFALFKYVSLFGLLNTHIDEFKNAILQADYNYEEGFSKTAPLYRLLITMMIEGYEKVETKLHQYDMRNIVTKGDDIENTIYRLPEVFTKDDIRALHPLTSESTINRTLTRLRDNNIIRPNGVGRSATWIRLVDREKFNPDVRQMNLFETIDDDN